MGVFQRTLRTSPIDAAEQIEKQKRDAKIARKMEPGLAHDSKILNIEVFEASVETAKPDEDLLLLSAPGQTPLPKREYCTPQ